VNRNIISEGIILKSQPFFEADRKILFLSPEFGLTEAFVYGTGKGKSRLASGTDILSSGKIFLYHDPVRKQYKVQDMEVGNLFLKIKSSLERYYKALLWLEIIIKSLGGSDSTRYIYSLLLESLELLDGSSAREEVDRLNLQFLWRYLVYQGYTTELDHCSQCGKQVAEREPLYFTKGFDPLVCGDCAGSRVSPLNPGARRYLNYTLSIPLKRAVKVSLEKASLSGATEIFLLYLESIVEAPLLTRRIAGSYL